jgi:hypothetical protein
MILSLVGGRLPTRGPVSDEMHHLERSPEKTVKKGWANGRGLIAKTPNNARKRSHLLASHTALLMIDRAECLLQPRHSAASI